LAAVVAVADLVVVDSVDSAVVDLVAVVLAGAGKCYWLNEKGRSETILNVLFFAKNSR
jgi:hypothetical protein